MGTCGGQITCSARFSGLDTPSVLPKISLNWLNAPASYDNPYRIHQQSSMLTVFPLGNNVHIYGGSLFCRTLGTEMLTGLATGTLHGFGASGQNMA